MLEVTIPQGALWRTAWPVFGPGGEPVTDLRLWQIRATARPHADSATELARWTYPTPPGELAGIEIFRALATPPGADQPTDTDWFRLIVRPSESRDWLWTYGVAQIELERGEDEVARPVELAITVSRETTR